MYVTLNLIALVLDKDTENQISSTRTQKILGLEGKYIDACIQNHHRGQLNCYSKCGYLERTKRSNGLGPTDWGYPPGVCCGACATLCVYTIKCY